MDLPEIPADPSALRREQDRLARQLAFRQRTLGEQHPGTLRTMDNLAEVLREGGNLRLARDLRQQLLEGCKGVFGERATETTLAAWRLARLLELLEQHQALAQLVEEDLGWLRVVTPPLLDAELEPVRDWVLERLDRPAA